jgi:Rab proteins geranylgeranyltransferase component A
VNKQSNHVTGVLYATALFSSTGENLLRSALDAFLSTLGENTKLLYSVYYEQKEGLRRTEESLKDMDSSLDLAFNDLVLEDVAAEWKVIMGDEVDQSAFMQFKDRPGMDEDNDNDVEY